MIHWNFLLSSSTSDCILVLVDGAANRKRVKRDTKRKSDLLGNTNAIIYALYPVFSWIRFDTGSDMRMASVVRRSVWLKASSVLSEEHGQLWHCSNSNYMIASVPTKWPYVDISDIFFFYSNFIKI